MFNMNRDFRDEYLVRENKKLREQLQVASALVDRLSSELMTMQHRGDARFGYMSVLEERVRKLEESLEKAKKEGEEGERKNVNAGYLEGDVHFCVPYEGNREYGGGDDVFEVGREDFPVEDDMYEYGELPDDEEEEDDDDDEDDVKVVQKRGGKKQMIIKPKNVPKAGKKEKKEKKPILKKKKAVVEVLDVTPASQAETQEVDNDSQGSDVVFQMNP